MTKSKKRCLNYLSFREVEKEISRCPALILPVGGCEPYGPYGCLSAATACAEALAAGLSEKLGLLYAPALPYGCSTAYGAFGGCAGVKPRTMTNILCEAVRRWQTQGFRTFIIIDCLYDNFEAIQTAVSRLNAAAQGRAIIHFPLQRDERVRAFTGRHGGLKEPGRTEYGILSLAASINGTLVRPAGKKAGPAVTGVEHYTTWRKRGGDPQQFRKLFPACSTSDSAYGFDPSFGKKLFDFTLQVLVDTVKKNI